MVTITRNEDRTVETPPAEYFTGEVRLERLFSAEEPARAHGARVTFQPGARTAWHTHPLGQRLIVTAGRGRVQRQGGPMESIEVGDVVWIGPGEKHWHGAAPDSEMTHFAVHEALDGEIVNWLEPVSDDEYAGHTRNEGG